VKVAYTHLYDLQAIANSVLFLFRMVVEVLELALFRELMDLKTLSAYSREGTKVFGSFLVCSGHDV
jgi:hypothetical protein